MRLNRFLAMKRKKKGLAQDDVGRVLGFGNGQYISNIEREECQLPVKHFKEIAKLYGVDLMLLIQMAVKDYKYSLIKEVIGTRRGRN